MDFAMSFVSDDRMWQSARMWKYDDLHNAPTCALNVRCLSSVTPRIRTESVTGDGDRGARDVDMCEVGKGMYTLAGPKDNRIELVGV